jgi:hypothetical protein
MSTVAIVCVLLTAPLGPAQQPTAKPRLDAYGVPLPDGAVARQAVGECDAAFKTLRADPEITSVPWVRFLADGRLLVRSRWHGRLNVWDPQRDRIVETFWIQQAPSEQTPFDYDTWGRLYAHHVDKGVALHNLVTDRQVCLLEGVEVGDAGKTVPRLSADGKRVLVTTPAIKGLLVRWFDNSSGRELGRYQIAENEVFPDHAAPVQWFSDDGTVFGYVTCDSRLALVNCAAGKVSRVVGVSVPVSRDDARRQKGVAAWHYESVGFDRLFLAWRSVGSFFSRTEYVVWDRATGQLLRRFLLLPEGVFDESWQGSLSPDGRFLAVHVVGQDRVLLYETATGRKRGALRAPREVRFFSFAPSGNTLATSCEDNSVLIWDLNRPLSGRPATPARDAAAAERCWKALGDPDILEPEPALWGLVHAPQFALPLLKRELRPEPVSARAHQLVAQLNSPMFKEREQAVAELLVLAERAVPTLRAGLETAASLEQRRRIEGLLARLDEPGAILACLRELRAIEVLERIGTVEARDLVEVVAGGDPNARLTREARATLARWR